MIWRGVLFLGWMGFAVGSFAEPTRIVYIGDSHSAGRFGKIIDDGFRAHPDFKFNFEASGGSAPLQWSNGIYKSSCGYTDRSSNAVQPPRVCLNSYLTPTLKGLLEQASSDEIKNEVEKKIAIIALGTNFGLKPEDHDWQVRSVSSLVLEAAKHEFQCIWIGPPQMKRFDAAHVEADYQLIRDGITAANQALGRDTCSLIDSRLYSAYPEPLDPRHENPDGIHYDFPMPWWHFPEGEAAAENWAKGILKVLNF